MNHILTEAVYKDGIFLPLTKPQLSEGQVVSIVLKPSDTEADEILDLAGQVYEGMSEQDIDEIEKIRNTAQAKQAVRRSQELVRKHIPSGLNLAENLICERRKESEHG